jgi:hypothetical protein
MNAAHLSSLHGERNLARRLLVVDLAEPALVVALVVVNPHLFSPHGSKALPQSLSLSTPLDLLLKVLCLVLVISDNAKVLILCLSCM